MPQITKYLKIKNLASYPLFVRRAFISFPIQMGGIFIQFLTAITIGRILGVEGYGGYVYAFALANIIGLIIGMGFDQLSVREAPKFIVEKDSASYHGLILSAFGVVIAGSILTYGVLTILTKTEILELSVGAGITTLIATGNAIGNILFALNQAFQKVILPQIVGRLLFPTIYFFTVLMWWWIFPEHKVNLVLSLYIGCNFLGALVLAFLLSGLLRSNFEKFVRPKFNFFQLISGSLPIVFVSFTYLINSEIDTLMIGVFLTDEDVGVYRAANRGAALVGLVLVVINQVLMPMLSRAISSDQIEEAQKIISLASVFLTILGVVSSLVIVFGATIFLGLFGEDFLSGEFPLKLLVIGSFADVITGTVGSILILTRKEKSILYINAFGILLNITLNLALISTYGITGAAIATASAMLVSRVVMIIYVFNKTPYNPTFFPLIMRYIKA